MATRTRKPKRKSGRRLAAELLSNSRCKKCGRPAIETIAEDSKQGTKWNHYCLDHIPRKHDYEPLNLRLEY